MRRAEAELDSIEKERNVNASMMAARATCGSAEADLPDSHGSTRDDDGQSQGQAQTLTG